MTPSDSLTVVFDACSLIAYLRDEPGAEEVERLLADPQVTCIAHRINLLEVYYDTLRQSDEKTAQGALAALRKSGLQERGDLQRPFLFEVGALKARRRLSLADCFCLALAQRLGATLLTADHHEFDKVAEEFPKAVRFIR